MSNIKVVVIPTNIKNEKNTDDILKNVMERIIKDHIVASIK